MWQPFFNKENLSYGFLDLIFTVVILVELVEIALLDCTICKTSLGVAATFKAAVLIFTTTFAVLLPADILTVLFGIVNSTPSFAVEELCTATVAVKFSVKVLLSPP